jgi:hypothetical protein
MIQWSGWIVTPDHSETPKAYNCPIEIKQKNHRKKDDSKGYGTD